MAWEVEGLRLYIFVFAVSLVLIAIAEKQKSKKIFWILSVIALLIPCLLAGFRNEHIGRDVLHYLKPMTDLAINSKTIGDFFSGSWPISYGVMHTASLEYGFTGLIYIFTKITRSLPAVQFLVSAMILVPVYIALARNREKAPLWLGMAVFYLLFYNGTLNLMRQWAATALLVLAFQLLLERKWILGVAISAVAVGLFHYSGALMAALFLMYGVLCLLQKTQLTPCIKGKKRVVSGQFVACGVIVIGSVFLVFNLPLVMEILRAIGLGRFVNYINGAPMELMPKEIFLRLPLLVMFLLGWKNWYAADKAAPFYFTVMILDVVSSQLTSVNPYTYRIGIYFSVFTLFSLPSYFSSLKKGGVKIAVGAFLLFYLLSYWGYLHTYLFLHQTYPYMSILR